MLVNQGFQSKKAILESNKLNERETQDALLQLNLKKLGYSGVLQKSQTKKQLTPHQLIAMSKYMEDIEPTWFQKKFGFLPGVGEGGSPEERAIAEQFKAQIAAQKTGEQYQIGQIITRGGQQYRVTGFDTDGTPLTGEIGEIDKDIMSEIKAYTYQIEQANLLIEFYKKVLKGRDDALKNVNKELIEKKYTLFLLK